MNCIEHGYEELFDIRHDPHEATNLVTDSKYKMKLKEMRIRYNELKFIYGVPAKDWGH